MARGYWFRISNWKWWYSNGNGSDIAERYIYSQSDSADYAKALTDFSLNDPRGAFYAEAERSRAAGHAPVITGAWADNSPEWRAENARINKLNSAGLPMGEKCAA